MSAACTLSIFCTAYNHEAYISQALDSFLMQKTDFPFEILVTDDASTDGTPAILQSYADRYPDIIRYFHQDRNLFSQGINIYEEIMYPNARGEFIAYCEGDDYWTDPGKLQLQVDYLRSHPDCSACVHNTMYHFCGSGAKEMPIIPADADRDLDFFTIILGMSHCFHTSSIVGRAEYICHPPEFQRVAYTAGGFTDYAIALWLCMNGKVHFIEKPMSVYRVNSNPESWSAGMGGRYADKTRFVRAEIEMMKSMLPMLSAEYASLTQQEMFKREYELLYLQGKAKEMTRPPYNSLFKTEPLSFKLKTMLKIIFPSLHEKYRSRQGYKE